MFLFSCFCVYGNVDRNAVLGFSVFSLFFFVRATATDCPEESRHPGPDVRVWGSDPSLVSV